VTAGLSRPWWWRRLLPCALLALASPASAQFRDFTFRIPPGGETTAGVAWADFDGDGDFDLFATTYGDSPGNQSNRLLENRGTAGFAAVDAPALELPRELSTSSAWADYDDDGDLDVFVACESDSGNSLFRNDGGGVFVDVTPPVLRTREGCYSSVWVDFDLDGDLDLSVASREGGKLFRNDGDGAFADATRPPLDAATWCLEWRDYDRDGDCDVFLGTVQSQGGAPLILARNDGGNRFVDVAAGALGGGDDGAFSGGFADFDADGDLDLYVTYFVNPAKLFRNDGTEGFSDITPSVLRGTGAAYTSMWVDYDNDGDPDLLRCGQLAGSTALYRNDGGAFSDASSALAGARLAANWSAAWGDWDADGRLDLYLGQAGTGSDALLRNETRAANHWLGVELEGVLSNRRGIGARIEVTAGGRTQIREISGGGDGWCSQEPAAAWFGLGNETTADVTVFWPSGQRRILTVIPVDRRITVREPGLAPIGSTFVAGERYDMDLLLGGARIGSGGAPVAHVRPAHSGAEFVPVPLIPIGGLFLRGTVEDSLLTEAGLEYYVEYALGSGSRRTTPFAGAAAPLFLPASFARLGPPEPIARERLAMFGFPFALQDSVGLRELSAELGEYDPVFWRAGRWDPVRGAYVEAPDSGFAVRTGDAFWVIGRGTVAPAAGGRTADPAGVPIVVHPGWNQIAHPFLFPVDLADVDFSAAPNVDRRAVGFRGGYRDETVLEPWRGYWMHNGSLSPQTIVVRGRPSSGPGAAPAAAVSPAAGGAVPAERWILTVDAEQGEAWDRGNQAAVAEGARDEAGAEDAPEPPGIPGRLRVWFDAGRDLTRDVREDGREGHVWDLRVSAPGGEPVTLAFPGVADIPAGLDVALVPEETFAFVDLRAKGTLELAPGEARSFRLAVGTAAFVADVRDGVELPPAELALGLAWPNPFASGTNVGFALTRRASVEAAVYDVTGRRVRTLVSGPLPAGRHRLEWEGTDSAGRPVASGVYFVRLRAEERSLARKVVLRR
jgi:hypothetical protein